MKFAAILFLLVAVSDAQRDPNEFCFECLGKRNHKDLYGNPDDCHTYFQCQYNGDGTAEGILRDCPPGTYWHDDILTCAPEGAVPCVDRCKEEENRKRGCYGSNTNCASFFVCSNEITFPFCCPPKTQFNEETCTCLETETCNDPCSIEGPEVPTTKQPPQVFDTFCIDSFGVTLRPGSAPANYLLVDRDDPTITTEKPCAFGTQFSLQECSCSIAVDIGQQPDTSKLCRLYLSFDDNKANDLSHNKFFVDIVEPSEVSTAAAAYGTGSLRNSGPDGRIEFPYLKGSVPPKSTVCLFFRCTEPPCTYSSGGILSKRGCPSCNTDQGFEVFFMPDNTLRCQLRCEGDDEEVREIPLPANTDLSNFIQFCLVRTTNKALIYINNELVREYVGQCNKLDNQCPLGIGHDIQSGSLEGFIDEIMMCPYDIGAEGVNAHFQGQDAVRAAGMLAS